MNAGRPISVSLAAKTALAVAVAAAATGLAFAAWIDNGAAMFMSLMQAGLAMCF